jgi:hypothetical protein
MATLSVLFFSSKLKLVSAGGWAWVGIDNRTRRDKTIRTPISLLQVENFIFLNIILTPQASERMCDPEEIF